MSNIRQALQGVLAALLSSVIVIGSFTLAVVESGVPAAQAPGPAATAVRNTPSPLPPIVTSAPGEPTFTAAPTSLPTSTPASESAFPTPGGMIPSPASSCPHPADWVPITVLPGDTVAGLAQLYKLPVETLMGYNCLVVESLAPGSILYVPGMVPTAIPTATYTAPPQSTEAPPASPSTGCGPFPGWVRYTVRPGDTLSSISQATGASIAQLQTANCMGSSSVLRTGQSIYVPRLPVQPTLRPTSTTAPTATAAPPTATVPPPTVVIPTNTQPPPPTRVPTEPPPPTDAPAPPSQTPPPPTQEPPTPVPPSPSPIPPSPTSPPPPTDAPSPPSQTESPQPPGLVAPSETPTQAPSEPMATPSDTP